MSNSANTLDTLNGLFKEIYGDKLENLVPDGVILYNRVPFVKREQQLGGTYHQPVILGHEHGVTFAASGDDAFTLNAPISGFIKDATVRGNQMVLRSAIGYASVNRSLGGGKKAFQEATKFLVSNMLRSMVKKLEIELFYGGMGYGSVASTSGNVITITTAEWAPGIWSGAENMPIDIRDSSGTTSRGIASITAVDFDNLTITVDSLPSGTTATDVIWHKGAYGNEFSGIHKIITNTGSLFGINATSYSLWKGNTYSASSAALSFAKVQKAIARAVEKGLDSDVVVLVNPNTWSNLLTEQTALRQFDQSYSNSELDNGSRSLKFFGQNGMVEIVPSIYVKQGYAFVLYMDDMVKIGSTDITFKRPGKGDEFFRDLENNAGYELRAYADLALFTHSPGKNVLINNIINS